MHDAVIAERLGLPAAAVMTAPFQGAARLMARALGAAGFGFVCVEHPISSAGDALLGERAREAAGEIAALLTGPA